MVINDQPLYVFNRSSGENLLKQQFDSSTVNMSSILMTTQFHIALVLQGEISCWSLLRLKGLSLFIGYNGHRTEWIENSIQ